MSLSKTLYPLLSTGSTYEDMAEENVDWYIKNEIKPTKAYTSPIKVNNVYTFMCEKGHAICRNIVLLRIPTLCLLCSCACLLSSTDYLFFFLIMLKQYHS